MTTITKKKLQPLGDRVLVQRIKEEETLKGGIILPDTAKKKQQVAVVITVGTGATTPEGKPIPFSVKAGDMVLINKQSEYSSEEITIEDEEFVILPTSQLISLIN